jgi:hypothetical protein
MRRFMPMRAFSGRNGSNDAGAGHLTAANPELAGEMLTFHRFTEAKVADNLSFAATSQIRHGGHMLNQLLQDMVLAVTQCGRTRKQSLGFFRVALGLIYLDGIMTEEEIDFKKIDSDFNQFIYRSIGKGHSITSILQFMSGAQVLPVLESATFFDAFSEHCSEVAVDKIPILLSVNLGVAKNISGIGHDGPVHDWISWQSQAQP